MSLPSPKIFFVTTMLSLILSSFIMPLTSRAASEIAPRPSPVEAPAPLFQQQPPIEPSRAITLTKIGSFNYFDQPDYQDAYFDESAAEIVAHDPATQQLFVVNGAFKRIDMVDISQVTRPRLKATLMITPYGGGLNSVAFHDGVGVAAIENNNPQDPGLALFFDAQGQVINQITVGPMPDMVTFTPDGNYVLLANEGGPNDDYTVDPAGSISIIDLRNGVQNAIVATAAFTAFDGREAELRAKGIRIFGPGASASQDLEPEYIAITPDSSTAAVTLQENNALAMVDIATAMVLDVLPLGMKDHSRGPAMLRQYQFADLSDLGTTPANQTIKLGGFSGLWFTGINGDNYQFVTVPDRGPNGDLTDVDNDSENERPFALPDYQARVQPFELNPTTGDITLGTPLMLRRTNGSTPITGLPNIPGVDEEPVDLNGNLLPYDEYGADMEGLVVDSSGHYWMVDEYRPAIYQFNADGVLLNRYVPTGTSTLAEPDQPVGSYGTETLPAEYSNRRPNRGFEAMALDSDTGILYAFIQTPLSNPDRAAGDASSVIRMLGIDPATGQPVAEYLYLLEKPAHRQSNVDKLGDAVYVGDGQFYVVERDSAMDTTAKKYLFKIDITGARNLIANPPMLMAGKTLEQHTPAELLTQAITPVNKIKLSNLPSLGYTAGDKIEGLALLPDGRLALLNDNDFGLLGEPIPGDGSIALDPNPTPIVLGLVDFAAGNTLDASDRDEAINLKNWPLWGMYMPDTIASYSVGGATYFVTANEGDTRDYDGYSEEANMADLSLDTAVLTTSLQADDQLGRLTLTEVNGDIDGDSAYEQLHSYGARSFSIWDAYGNLVYDSSDDFERITAHADPDYFNATDNENNFDNRSDNKGPEPEALTMGEIEGRTYAFIGLERVGGIMVYDVTEPMTPTFVQYLNTRNFRGNPEEGTAGDLAPEGMRFITATDSPTGEPLLVVAYEVSGSTAIFGFDIPNTTIPEIQDEGASSPLENEVITTEGVVTARFFGPQRINGFFIQSAAMAGDNNPATSEGLYVAHTAPLSIGDYVRLTGQVVERFAQTQLQNIAMLEVISHGNTVAPTAVTLPFADAQTPERYEGMLINMPQTLHVTELYNLGRFGEVLLSSGARLMQPTNVVTPGAPANSLAAQNARNQILLDDANPVQNPQPVPYPSPGLSPSNLIRGGDTVSGLTGVLAYGFGSYRLYPTSPPNFVAANPRPAMPPAVGDGSLKVASFNVLNYFTTIDDGANDARGADSMAEFMRQRSKIITAMLKLEADVIGLMEIENNGSGPASAIQDLVNGLNKHAPAGTSYALVNPGPDRLGMDAIAVGLLYRTETVTTVGPAAMLNSGIFSNTVDKHRVPLAQTFAEQRSGARLTVVVNHFKSKGSDCEDLNDPDMGDGQGNCNLTRLQAANELADWLATDPTRSRDPDYLIIGDLNAYAMEDPLRALAGKGYTDLVAAYGGEMPYSYVFRGQWGYLDHALANHSLAAQITGAAVWHTNADEARIFDYNTEFNPPQLYQPNSYRASDHDAVVVGLKLQPPPITLTLLHNCLREYATTEVATTEVLLDVSRAGSRGRETNAGNLIADSYLYVQQKYAVDNPHIAPPGARTIAVQNGGGIRQNAGDILPVGGMVPATITVQNTFDVLAFTTNSIAVVKDIPPTDIKAIFERAASQIGGGQFLQIAGLNVTYNLSNTAQVIATDGTVTVPGERVVSMVLADGTVLVQNGMVVTTAPSLTITTNSFTAGGGDNYPWLGRRPAVNLLDADGVIISYDQAWREYLQDPPAGSRAAPMGGLGGQITADNPRYQVDPQQSIRFGEALRTPEIYLPNLFRTDGS